MSPRPQDSWEQICLAAGLDPQKRLAARQAVLGHADALECTLYRPDEHDLDAEEEDLGDARILFTGPFQAPEAWGDQEREDYFGDLEPAAFVTALIECEAEPSSAAFFLADAGDFVAVVSASGEVQMYYLYDCQEDDDGLHCVLVREDEEG
ncbi:hypothetical protein [Metapseudomonas furukawaii]|uniref:Uncharacterized protein n=1 Tax=Metapseudomonas furukawaii TaxID=1149133 RepID=A0AAD1FEV6_METFU|nr:hypothetical protein ppKF707_5804 [Pseudomonas furukawaii]BAU72868.1 hypothetical protein KF707C_11800 [Pseudomonas furukawaii]